jgi:hypothetical protein
MFDHPRSHGESRRARWFPWDSTFGHPGERPIFTVPEWGTVERRGARHHRRDAIEVVGVDSLLELADLL